MVRLLRENGVAAEVNFHTNTPDPRFFRACLDAGVKLTFGSDAHEPHAIGEFTPHVEFLSACGYNGDVRDVLWTPPADRRAAQGAGASVRDREEVALMHALQLVSPRTFRRTSVPDPPDALPPGHVVVRLETAAVCGSDMPYYTGRRGPYPLEPGLSIHECAGRVERSSSGRLRAGEKVLAVPRAPAGPFRILAAAGGARLSPAARPRPRTTSSRSPWRRCCGPAASCRPSWASGWRWSGRGRSA